MTRSSRLPSRRFLVLAIACAGASLLQANLRADEPDALPLPRAKTPKVLKLPDDGNDAPTRNSPNPRGGTNPLREGAPEEPADAGTDDAKAAPADDGTAKPTTGNDAELPRPTGKPGRAPDPDGVKGDGAKMETKKDAKKEPPPADGRCDECGSCVCVSKQCVPKLEEKEITKVCWDAKCEDFCVPGRSIWCGTKCQKDDCGCWSHEIWKPTCAEVRTRVVPVRKTTKRKVPSVKWTVVERCACCRAKAACGAAPGTDAATEKKPADDAKGEAPAEKGDSPQPASPKPDASKAGVSVPDAAPAPKKTAARPAEGPGFSWPWAKWVR